MGGGSEKGLEGKGRRGKGIGLTWINLAAKEPTGEVKARASAFVLACVLGRHSIKWIISKIDGRLFGICRAFPLKKERVAHAAPGLLYQSRSVRKLNIYETGGGGERAAHY